MFKRVAIIGVVVALLGCAWWGITILANRPGGFTIFESSVPAEKKPGLLYGFKSFHEGNGDLAINGHVTRGGVPLGNALIVLLFKDYMMSPTLITSSDGRFQFRMPPGEWHLQSPFLPDFQNAEFRYELDGDIDPLIRRVEVKPGDVKRSVNMKIEVPNPALHTGQ